MQIVNMKNCNVKQLDQAAQILTDSLPLGWPDFAQAEAEVRQCLAPGNTMLVALENDTVLGWGGILSPEYDGRVFELHPLAVRSDRRRQGIGRALVTALESEARARGGLTLQLGADDEQVGGQTSLAHVDLYDHLPDKLKNFDPGTHQSAFYLRLGFKLVGVMPDANGVGKPDIFLAKKL